MIPLTDALKTVSTRLVLACLLAGSLVGAMLGAAVGFMWAQKQTAGAQSGGSAAVQSNQQLAGQLRQLQADLEALRQPGSDSVTAPAASEYSAATTADNIGEGAAVALPQDFINQVASQIATPARARFKEPDYDKAMQRLTAAGFSAYDAERIFAMEAEAQLRFIDTMSNPALRGGVAARDIMHELGENLREYLGDYGYENYLRSKNLPTAVKIYRVEDDSAAAVAGLQKGDEIVRYAGRRVFSITGLNQLVAQGQPGQSMSLQVLRQGTVETIEIPAGAIGITSRPLSPRAVFDLH